MPKLGSHTDVTSAIKFKYNAKMPRQLDLEHLHRIYLWVILFIIDSYFLFVYIQDYSHLIAYYKDIKSKQLPKVTFKGAKIE